MPVKKMPTPAKQGCFSDKELEQYLFQSLPPDKRRQVFEHLNTVKCETCRTKVVSILRQRKIEALIQNSVQKGRPFSPIKVEKGQVWRTSPEVKDDQDRLITTVPVGRPIVVYYPGNGRRSMENGIRVIPISDEIAMGNPPETILIKQMETTAGLIRDEFLCEIFNERPMAAGNLHDCLGNLTPKDLSHLQNARNQYWFKKDSKAKKGISNVSWKQREIEAFLYLTWPVNQALPEEPEEEEEHLIQIEPFREAADTKGIPLREVHPHVLQETEQYSITVVQVSDQLFLRFFSDQTKIQTVRMNRQVLGINRKKGGGAEVKLGGVKQLTGQATIELTINNNTVTLQVNFMKIS